MGYVCFGREGGNHEISTKNGNIEGQEGVCGDERKIERHGQVKREGEGSGSVREQSGGERYLVDG